MNLLAKITLSVPVVVVLGGLAYLGWMYGDESGKQTGLIFGALFVWCMTKIW